MTSNDVFHYAQQPKIAVPNCPVCGTPNKGYPCRERSGYLVTFAPCRGCELGYLGEIMTRAGYAALYGGDPSPYRHLVWRQRRGLAHVPYDTATDRRDLKRIQDDYASTIVSWLRHRINPALVGGLLDAGGSTGIVGQLIHQYWPTLAPLTVLDPSPSELPTGDAAVQTIQGYLEDPIPGHYAFINCCQTLDHVTQPVAVLTNLRNALAPGGQMYIDIALFSRLKIDHPLRWNEPSFKRALGLTGWRILHERQNNFHLGVLCEKG